MFAKHVLTFVSEKDQKVSFFLTLTLFSQVYSPPSTKKNESTVCRGELAAETHFFYLSVQMDNALFESFMRQNQAIIRSRPDLL